MNSSVVSCCTCFRMASCASGTSASWPTGDVPLSCLFAFSRSARHRRQSKTRHAPKTPVIFGSAPSVLDRWRSSRGSPLPRCNFVLHLGTALPHETTLPSKKPCVLRHDPSLFALSPNKFLLPASSPTLFATFFRNRQLPSASCHLLCSAAQSRRTSTPALRSIEFP
jgi:hypothetical protein